MESDLFFPLYSALLIFPLLMSDPSGFFFLKGLWEQSLTEKHVPHPCFGLHKQRINLSSILQWLKELLCLPSLSPPIGGLGTIPVPQHSGPQPFWHQGLVSWKKIFPQTGVGVDGFGMIQAHYICCALYFYCYYIVICSEIIIKLIVMLTGGGAQAVMRTMRSGCKYR